MNYDLSRYITAYQESYQKALSEVRNGRKTSHWTWYIFPQIIGLGRSSMSRLYAIQSLDEARAFLTHPYLGQSLLEISRDLLGLGTSNARDVFGPPDDMKLKSSMTLFANVGGDNQVFIGVLDKYFDESQDEKTLRIINNQIIRQDMDGTKPK